MLIPLAIIAAPGLDSFAHQLVLAWPCRLGIGTLDDYATQIKRVEGFYPPGTPGYASGSLAWRNNNPGNIRYTPYYAKNFAATEGAGGYARFPDYNTGWAALKHQITLDANRGLTILTMMKKYAPSQDGNDPDSYAATIARALGVSVDTPVSSLIGNSPQAPVQTATPALVQGGVAADAFGGSFEIAGVQIPILAGAILGGAVIAGLLFAKR